MGEKITSSMKPTPLGKREVVKLNKAVETLRSFCESRSSCYGCPFRNEDFITYGDACKFGYFYPGLWNELEIKEESE